MSICRWKSEKRGNITESVFEASLLRNSYHNNPTNWWWISLTSGYSKIAEHIAHRRSVRHLRKENIHFWPIIWIRKEVRVWRSAHSDNTRFCAPALEKRRRLASSPSNTMSDVPLAWKPFILCINKRHRYEHVSPLWRPQCFNENHKYWPKQTSR